MTVLFGLLMFAVASVPPAAVAQSSSSGRMTLATMSDATEMVSLVQLRLLGDTDLGSGEIVSDDAFFQLLNFIDLHVIGQGRVSVVDVELVSEFVRQRRNDPGLSGALVAEYQRSGFVDPVAKTRASDESLLDLGGFLVGEIERHQEPDGHLATLYEINQLRLYFSRELNTSSAVNRVSVLAEWNPVPEEVVHQPDVLTITRDGVTDTIAIPPAPVDDLIQFEQLHARVSNVAGSGVEVTIGQFRNPFGLWSDYTSHRNFTTTKNSVLVNGFALKKIELGIMARRSIGAGFEIQAALVHGRQSRTSSLPRADADDAKDVVGRITYEAGRGRVFGTSFYLGEMSARRNVAYQPVVKVGGPA